VSPFGALLLVFYEEGVSACESVNALDPVGLEHLMGFGLAWLGGGYGRIDGGVYTVFLVITDEVSDEERDDFLRIFSHHDYLRTLPADVQDTVRKRIGRPSK
jgi:hypothetical protein